MRKQRLPILPYSALLCGLWAPSALAGTFNHNFNTDPSLDANPIQIRSTAVWRASGSHDGTGYISITDDLGSQEGAIVLPDFDGGVPIMAFNLQVKLRIGGGTARPADGLSISFADPADGVIGGGTVGEEGTGSGLTVNFDTYDNGNGDAIAIDVKLDGVILAHKRFSGARDAGSDGVANYKCAPVERDGAGNPISLETDPAGTADPGTFVDLEINLSTCGAFSLKYKGIDIYKDIVLPGWGPRAGRFVIGARTGGAWDNHWIDDLKVSTSLGVDSRPFFTASTPGQHALRDLLDDQVISFTLRQGLFGVNPATIRLVLNGTDITLDPNTTITPGSPDTTITYTPATPYAPGSRQEAVLTFSDMDTPPVSCSGRQVFYVSPLPASGTLYVEAEDFNYNDGMASGKFFDFGSPVGSYMGLGAVNGVDHFQALGNPDSDVYRTEMPNNGISVPGTADDLRGGVMISPDYKVGWNDNGDWFNYTRTFPNTTYKVYGRFSSGGADTHARLDRVTSDPSMPGQTTAPLGTFDGEATAGWDTFCFIPLRNASGQDVIVRLNGLTTLRVSTLPGNYDINYVAFVPTPSPTLRPNVVGTEPPAGGESLRDPKIKVVIADADTAVVHTSIRLFLDDVELMPVTRTDTPGGAEAEFQVTTSLAFGSSHTAKAIFTDNDATPATQESRWTFTVGPFKRGSATLFVEAEDFNYSDEDGSNPGQHADFGDPACPTLNKEAVFDVDYGGSDANDPGAAPAYRGMTGVEVAKPGTDGFVRGDHTVECSYIVGWNDAGDWYNYTRTFPTPSKRYNVFARLSSGGAAENAELALVTSDPTMPGQTTEPVGTFNSPATGNWDMFHTVPLRDGAGNLASVRLGGLTTFRFTVLPGNLDFNYLAFVESDVSVLTPTVAMAEPRPGSDYARAPKIAAVIQDQDSRVVAGSLKLFFNGANVTMASTITDTAGGAMIEYQAPGGSPQGVMHTARVEWMDDQATPAAGSFDWSYREGMYNAEKNLFIELEDFNTDSGMYIPSTAGHPFNQKGQYNGVAAVHDVDYHLAASNPDSPLYRVLSPPNGIVNLDDSYRTGAGPRPGFEVVPDYKVGWTDPGDWFNYTRDYGAGGFYNIFLRASHGDAAMTIGGQLDSVDDATIPIQTTTALGDFRAPATGNWDGFTFIPLRTADGAVALVPLNGVKTVRYTVEANGGDVNYLMLCPVCPGLTINRDGAMIKVEWVGGTLQSAPRVTGPWGNVTGATPPSYMTPTSGTELYFRTICP